MRTLEFLLGALKDLKTVGSLFPHTPMAARKMTKPVDFGNARVIVELGGGNGAVTRDILRRMRSDAKLFVFEIHPDFAESLRRIGDGRMTVIQDSAEHLEKYLNDYGLSQVDAVISTLPLVIIDEPVRGAIIEAAMRVLKTGGYFVQIQYSLATKKDMRARFKNLKIDFTPFNLPPAFFYIVKKLV